MTNHIRNSSLRMLLLGMAVLAWSANAQEKPASETDMPRYKDATQPIADRVADLLPRMTLEEKVYQLTGGWDTKVDVIDPTGTFTAESARRTLSAEWGAEVKFTPRQAAILHPGSRDGQISVPDRRSGNQIDRLRSNQSAGARLLRRFSVS